MHRSAVPRVVPSSATYPKIARYVAIKLNFHAKELIVGCLTDLYWRPVLHRVYRTLFPLGQSRSNCVCRLQRPRRPEPDVCFPCEAGLLLKNDANIFTVGVLGRMGRPGFAPQRVKLALRIMGVNEIPVQEFANTEAHIPQAAVAVELHLTAIPLLGRWPNVQYLSRCSHLLGEILRSQRHWQAQFSLRLVQITWVVSLSPLPFSF